MHDANRWHSNSDPRLRNCGDTVTAHHKRVADLVARICAARGELVSHDLALAARNHDIHELVIGDIPAPAKARFPYLAKAEKKAAKAIRKEAGLHWKLNKTEKLILRLADKLDAYLTVENVAPDLCAKPEWRSEWAGINIMADQLGVTEFVENVR